MNPCCPNSTSDRYKIHSTRCMSVQYLLIVSLANLIELQLNKILTLASLAGTISTFISPVLLFLCYILSPVDVILKTTEKSHRNEESCSEKAFKPVNVKTVSCIRCSADKRKQILLRCGNTPVKVPNSK